MKSILSSKEIEVLKVLDTRGPSLEDAATREIADIAVAIGSDSNEDVQRALFILEGRQLVSPHPQGDLTSNYWRITDNGKKALNLV